MFGRKSAADRPRVLRKDRRGRNPVTVGILALVLIGAGTYLGFTKHIPFTQGYRLHAVFQSANSIRKNSFVRIAGINVGKVVDVSRYRHTDLSDVTMEISDNGLPIHNDATLKIRPRIFLEGNFFVDLKPGSPSAPVLHDGDTIGPSQTATPVQLDQVLTALQSDSRLDLQHVLKGLGESLNTLPTPSENATQGPADQNITGAQGFNRSYKNAAPAFRGTSLVNQALLGDKPHSLSQVIAGVGSLTKALDSREVQLSTLFTNFSNGLSGFASQSAALASSIRLLGPTLTTARDAFASLDKAFPSTRAFALELIPGVRETPAMITAALPWIAQTRALLRKSELNGLLAQLQPLTADTARLTATTVKFLPQIDTFDKCISRVVIPSGNIGVQDGPITNRKPNGSIVENYKEFWSTMVGFAGEGQNFDGNGHYIHLATGGGAYTVGAEKSKMSSIDLYGNAPRMPLGTSPRYTNLRPPYRPNVPCYTQKLPDVNGSQAHGPADLSRAAQP
jgi:phospholipid/cholesterol/gamma-HCH transport system substrate-binding protein